MCNKRIECEHSYNRHKKDPHTVQWASSSNETSRRKLDGCDSTASFHSTIDPH
ncbi:hypothetical protein C1H46_007431 [Malus baccata]|uniref:Uncharacterized protein n=1 Tax=Malus baccata TaxID=106549 RepID=A0A540N773_MALBA|nr:hypothetical protein C1H46_007431 [Malus baccata]